MVDTGGERLGVLAVLLTAVLWGTTGTAATFAPGVAPVAIGSAALGIGGLLQGLVAATSIRADRPRLGRHKGLIATGAVAVAVYPLAFYSSMHLAGVAIGTAVSLASAPVASGILEWALTRRPVSLWWTVATMVGVLATVLLCLSRPGDGGGSTVAGVLLGLVAGASYAGYSWICHALMNDGVPRAAAMGSVFGCGGLLLMPVLIVTGAPILSSTHSFVVTVYMALVPMFLGYLLFGFGLTRLSAGTATTITLAEPAVAALLAVLVVGERLGPTGWVGLVLVAVALVILAVEPATDDGATTAGE